jgi:hypothetical protein
MKKILMVGVILLGIANIYAQEVSPTGPDETGNLFPGFRYDDKTGTWKGEPLTGPPLSELVPTMEEWWRDIGLTNPQEIFPFSIEVIDETQKVCRLIFGDPNGSNVSIEVSPEGIRSPEGTLVDPDFTLEVDGQQVSISVETINENGDEAFNIIITPQSSGFPLQGQYSRSFTLGHLQGEINVNASAAQPAISITLRNPDHAEMSVETTPDGPRFSATGVVNVGEEAGDYGRLTATVRIHDGKIEIDGRPTWRLSRGGYTVELKIGEYLQVSQDSEELISDLDEVLGPHLPGMSDEERRKFLQGKLQDSVEELQQALARAFRGEAVQVPDSLKFFFNLGTTPEEQEKIMEAVLPIVMGKVALELSADRDMREAKLVFTLAEAEDENGNPKIIYGIGIRDENGEIKGVFSASDSTGKNALEIVHSFAQGLQKVMLRSGGLEMSFTPDGWAVGSAQGNDLISRMRATTEPGFGWRYSYSRRDGWALELSYSIPYQAEEEKEDENRPRTLRSFIILGPQGLQELGIRLPLGGGILEWTPRRVSYTMQREGAMVRGTVEGGGFSLEFEIPIGGSNKEGAQNKNFEE